MDKHLHKRLDNEFIKSIFQKYISNNLTLNQVLEILKLKRTRFFELLKLYKNNSLDFSVEYKRKTNKKIIKELESIIINELNQEKQLIDNKDIPIYNYNYSYIKDQIYKKHKFNVSLPTIINRAKTYNYYKPKKAHKKHDREVLTNYPGELIQHDSSYHKFSPYADKKWYLITSLDDYSRYMLYADLIEKETSWAHILSLESIFLKFGVPLSYYVDSHSIFRFVQGRDSNWRTHKKVTDESTPQWKQVLMDLNVNIIYALSPQAKGKIERPYQWLQDRIVRTCARENIKSIDEARKILYYEINRYNNKQVHSTTKEIPIIRFKNALSLNSSLFREFKIPQPFISTKDIFCFRLFRTVDAYRKISIDNIEFKINDAPIREQIEIRIVPNIKRGISELRFWHKKNLIDVHIIKNKDLSIFTLE